MRCRDIRRELIFYTDHELSVEKHAAVKRHLEKCTSCEAYYAFLQGEMEVIGKERNQEASPFFYTRLSARLEGQPNSQAKKIWVQLLQPAFFTLLLIAGIYSSIRLGSNAASPVTLQAPLGSDQFLNDFAIEPIESFLLHIL